MKDNEEDIMPRTEKQNAAIREKRKKKIFKTVLMLYALDGFDDTTLDTIAFYGKGSHGLFYHYFESKEEAYNALEIELKENHPEWIIDKGEILAKEGEGLDALIDKIEAAANGDITGAYYIRFLLTKNATTKTASIPLFGDDITDYLPELVENAKEAGHLIDIPAEEIVLAIEHTLNGFVVERAAPTRGSADLEAKIVRLWNK